MCEYLKDYRNFMNYLGHIKDYRGYIAIYTELLFIIIQGLSELYMGFIKGLSTLYIYKGA